MHVPCLNVLDLEAINVSMGGVFAEVQDVFALVQLQFVMARGYLQHVYVILDHVMNRILYVIQQTVPVR